MQSSGCSGGSKEASSYERSALLRHFSLYDADGDGSIDAYEFQKMMADLGQHFTMDEVNLSFAACCNGSNSKADLDRLVQFEDFFEWWNNDCGALLGPRESVQDSSLDSSASRRRLTMLGPNIYLSVHQRLEDDGGEHADEGPPQLTTFTFHIEVTSNAIIDCKIDISESVNLTLLSRHSRARQRGHHCISIDRISPFTRVEVMKVGVEIRHAPWKLAYESAYRARPLLAAELSLNNYMLRLKDADDANVDASFSAFQELLQARRLDPDSHDARAMIELLEAANVQFMDMSFPPFDASIAAPPNDQGGSSFHAADTDADNTDDDIDDNDLKGLASICSWRRSSDLFADQETAISVDAHIFGRHGVRPNGIQHGCLGNCWLICALSLLAERPALVTYLIAEADGAHVGMYRVRICNGGVWKTITLDDFFPCFPSAGPLFSRSSYFGAEIGVMLVEKAFAKLFGSYESLKRGTLHEGLMDISGCPVVTHLFNNLRTRDQIASGHFWKALKSNLSSRHLVCCSTPLSRGGTNNEKLTGLIPGRSYNILNAIEVHGYMLVRIRNPWGNFKWDGEWSAKSLLWTDKVKSAVQQEATGGSKGDDVCGVDDGSTFWVSYEELLLNFSSMTVCFLTSSRGVEWERCRKKVSFERIDNNNEIDQKGPNMRNGTRQGRSETLIPDGFCEEYSLRSKLYKLSVPKRSEVVFALHNRDGRFNPATSMGGGSKESYPLLGLTILQKQDFRQSSNRKSALGVGGYSLVASIGVSSDRQVQVEAVALEAGHYFVVPYTCSGANLEGSDDGNFESFRDLPSISEDSKDGLRFNSMIKGLEEVFDRFDEDFDDALSREEMSALLDVAVNHLQDPGCAQMRAALKNAFGYEENASFVTKATFTSRAADILRGEDKGSVEVLTELLLRCGYEEDVGTGGGAWKCVDRLPATLTIHAELPCKLNPFVANSLALRDAIELPVRLRGTEDFNIEHGVKTFTLLNGPRGVSLGVQNVRRVDMLVLMDCSDSINTQSHRASLAHEVRLSPGTFSIVHHLFPVNADSPWTWSFKLAVK